MKKYIIISLIIVHSFVLAQNKDLHVTLPITNVIVYTSSSEVFHTGQVAIPKGESRIVFSDLTPHIIENTINIFNLSNDIEIISVTEKLNYLKERKKEAEQIKSIRDSVAIIENELGLLKCQTDALTAEKDLLFKNESIGGVSSGVSVSEIEKASIFYNKRATDINTSLFKIYSKEQQLSKRLENLTKHLDEITANTQKATSEVWITLKSSESKTIDFKLKYLTSECGWSPVYNCRYNGLSNSLSFVFRANVFNATGISWENVDIKLSTANPTSGFEIPSLKEKNKSVSKVKSTKNEVRFDEIQVPNAIFEYDIKNKYTIPSDAKPYLIFVNDIEMKADFHYLAIPKIDQFGFLLADIPSWNNYNLIPGILHIYNKGSYMGKTFLNTNTDNDTLRMYLGKDNSIQISIKERMVLNKKVLIGNYYVEKNYITIHIKNSGSEKVDVQLLDNVPVFDIDDKIKFSINNIDGADFNKQEGLINWDYNLNPEESKVIDYRYEIKIPKNDIGKYMPAKRRFRTISSPSF